MNFNNSENVDDKQDNSNFLSPPPPPIQARHPIKLENRHLERSNSVPFSDSLKPPPVPMRSMSHDFGGLKAQINSTVDRLESQTIEEAAGQILSNQAQVRVNSILSQIEQISDIERFYLYLQLPTNVYQDSRKYQEIAPNGHASIQDFMKQKAPFQKTNTKLSKSNSAHLQNLAKQHTVDQDSECILTFQKRNQEKMARQWIQDNLQLCGETSLARKDVYEEYEIYIRKLGSAPLLQSDFGKVMRLIFPEVKSRRLGARGSSKYCYAGLRKKTDPGEPNLPMIGRSGDNDQNKDGDSKDGGEDKNNNETPGLKGKLALPRPPLFNKSTNDVTTPSKRVKSEFVVGDNNITRPNMTPNPGYRQSIPSDEGIFSTNTSPLSLIHSSGSNLSPCILDMYGRPHKINSNNSPSTNFIPLNPLIKTENPNNFLLNQLPQDSSFSSFSKNTKVQTIANTVQNGPNLVQNDQSFTKNGSMVPPPQDVLSCVEFLRKEGILPANLACSAVGGNGEPIKITYGNRTLTVKRGVAQNNLTVYQISSGAYNQFFSTVKGQIIQPNGFQDQHFGHQQKQMPQIQTTTTSNSSKTKTLNNSVNQEVYDNNDTKHLMMNNSKNNNTDNNDSCNILKQQQFKFSENNSQQSQLQDSSFQSHKYDDMVSSDLQIAEKVT